MQNKKLFPNTDALLKAAAFRNPETARYTADQFQSIINNFKLQDNPPVQNMSKYLNQYADILDKEQPSMKAAMSASPDALKRPDQIRQDNFAQDAQKSLGEVVKSTTIDMSYGISDQSEMLRIYSIGEERADASMNEKLDNILSAWLVSNDLFIKDGTLYESEEGEPKLNKDGTLKTTDPNQVIELFEDPDQGLSAYAKKRGLNLETHLYPYPASKAAVSQQAQAKNEIQPAEAVSPGVSNQTSPEIEPSGSSMGHQG